MSQPWIDLTIDVHDDMLIFPGDPTYHWEQCLYIKQGDVCNLSRMELGVHTGTHLDAPRHMIADSAVISDYDINQLCGDAYVVEFNTDGDITAEMLDNAAIPANVTRLLCGTANTAKGCLKPPFQADYCGFDVSAANWMADRQLKLIGLDFLTIEHSTDLSFPVHKTILGAGIAVLEGVDMAKAPLGSVELICAPMKLLHAEGAPCRVLVRSI